MTHIFDMFIVLFIIIITACFYSLDLNEFNFKKVSETIKKFSSEFVDDQFGEPKDIAALVIILMRDISRMGYIAKQAFEVLEINAEKAIDVVQIQDEDEINESFRDREREVSWNRMTSIYEVAFHHKFKF